MELSELNNKIFLTQLEIRVFCNMYYDGEGVDGTIVKKLNNGRFIVSLDKELNINGYKYKDITISDSVKNMSDEELAFCFEAQKEFFANIKQDSRLN